MGCSVGLNDTAALRLRFTVAAGSTKCPRFDDPRLLPGIEVIDWPELFVSSENTERDAVAVINLEVDSLLLALGDQADESFGSVIPGRGGKDRRERGGGKIGADSVKSGSCLEEEPYELFKILNLGAEERDFELYTQASTFQRTCTHQSSNQGAFLLDDFIVDRSTVGESRQAHPSNAHGCQLLCPFRISEGMSVGI